MNAQFATGAPGSEPSARQRHVMAVAVTVGRCTRRISAGRASATAAPSCRSAATPPHRKCSCWSAARRCSTSATDHARLVDQPERRRRDGHHAEPAADPRQGARHHLDVRLGPGRRHQAATKSTVRRDLSQLGEQLKQLFPGEPISVHSNGKDVVHLRHRRPASTSSKRRLKSRPAMSRRRRTSSTCCAAGRRGDAIRCCCACASPK